MASPGEQEESARLWKVNRTIHELVKDRVSCMLHGGPTADAREDYPRDSRSPTTKSTWTWLPSVRIMLAKAGQ